MPIRRNVLDDRHVVRPGRPQRHELPQRDDEQDRRGGHEELVGLDEGHGERERQQPGDTGQMRQRRAAADRRLEPDIAEQEDDGTADD